MTTATTPITNPNVTRSRLVLEIASEMAGGAAADAVPDYILPIVSLRHSRGGKAATFSGVSSAEGIFAVAAREIDLAMITPATVLSVALRGQGIFKQPMPVRAVAVIPSWDQFVFAVRPETGLARFEDIAAQKPKLRILMRATPDHSLHHMFDASSPRRYGFFAPRHRALGRRSAQALRRRAVLPYTETFKALIRGDVDAILRRGRAFPGCRRHSMPGSPSCRSPRRRSKNSRRWAIAAPVLPASVYPKLPHRCAVARFFRLDACFVHAEADDELVTQICESGLDARARRASRGRSRATCRWNAWRAKRSTRRNACRCIRPPSVFGAAAVIFESGIVEREVVREISETEAQRFRKRARISWSSTRRSS